jgi:hypothetical protein
VVSEPDCDQPAADVVGSASHDEHGALNFRARGSRLVQLHSFNKELKVKMKTIVLANYKELIRRHEANPEIDAEIEREPIENAVLQLQLSHDATAPDGSPAEKSIDIPLTTDAAIPADTKVWPNDKLQPLGTHYVVSVHEPYSGYVYNENLAIIGEGPVDLNRLTPLGMYPRGLEALPEPVPPPLPAKRVRGAKYSGFVADIYGTGVGSMTIEGGRKHSSSFYLPYRAVVRRASIVVDVPQSDRSVLVELYSVDDEKTVCSANIDVSELRYASAFFDTTVILNQGEYLLKWSVNAHSSNLKVQPMVRFSV